eukprot:TRINITY_DN2367_c0_g1_i1.p1 TRINITY_DN2367_c0_g1~~TRINITY_DN2367_c0_g1_i1.p1  ORF type:complete len:298 (-),score=54.80 TRINITY_DN2367_c0_g1_i1:236-1129(-)
MKIIQLNGGYSKEELASYKYIVYGNCIGQMKVLLTAANKLGIEVADENKEAANSILHLTGGGESWTKEVGERLKALWRDKGITHTYSLKDKKFQLNDSASYFFDHLDRIQQEDYLPTVDDVLRVRVRSTGIDEAQFKFENMEFRMMDVGGQRSERRKWIHCFDSVTAIIFCVSLSEYDQTLREDESQNRMKESLLLFEEICNSPWFKTTSMILFFNKTDLFGEKISQVDLKVCFEDYRGGLDYDAASSFIRQKFLDQNTSSHVIYNHFTCAVNTENISFVFNSVRETLLKNVLADIF